MSILNTINAITETANVAITGTKVDGTAYNRTVTFNSGDQKAEDVLVVQQDGDYRSFKTSLIESISVA